MNQTNDEVNDFFDLKNVPQEEQDEFFQDFGDLIMKKVFQKACVELVGNKQQTFLDLLEASEASPDDADKQNAVFNFLDENVPNVGEYIAQEVAEMQSTFTECREELLDAIA
jgi:hypothetical protein